MSNNTEKKNIIPAAFAGTDEPDVIQGPKLVPAPPKAPKQNVEELTEVIAEVVSAEAKPVTDDVVEGLVLQASEIAEEAMTSGAASKFKSAFAKGKDMFHRYKTPALIGAGTILIGLVARALINSNLVTPEVIEVTDEPAYYDDADHTDSPENTEEA